MFRENLKNPKFTTRYSEGTVVRSLCCFMIKLHLSRQAQIWYICWLFKYQKSFGLKLYPKLKYMSPDFRKHIHTTHFVLWCRLKRLPLLSVSNLGKLNWVPAQMLNTKLFKMIRGEDFQFVCGCRKSQGTWLYWHSVFYRTQGLKKCERGRTRKSLEVIKQNMADSNKKFLSMWLRTLVVVKNSHTLIADI